MNLARKVGALLSALCLCATPLAAAAPRPAFEHTEGLLQRQTPPEPTSIIVKFRPGVKDQESLVSAAAAADDITARTHGRTVSDALVVTTSNPKALANRLSKNPNIEYAELNITFSLAQTVPARFTPNDPLYTENMQWPLQLINLDDAWATYGSTYTGAGTTVAVVDSGITDHPDIKNSVVGGYDFNSDPLTSRDGDGIDADYSDPGDWTGTADTWCLGGLPTSSWHGTHVAGIATADTNNAAGIASPASDAGLLPVRATGICGGSLADIATAIVWASGYPVSGAPDNTHPADVINVSLEADQTCPATFQQAVNIATRMGATVVAAAGNGSLDAADTSPGSCDNVLTVGAVNSAGDPTYYSNFGPAVDIWAPGGQFGYDTAVMSTYNTGTTIPGEATYRALQGTSMAAPLVTGTIALLKQADPTLTPAQITTILTDTATPDGILDVAAALAKVAPPPPTPAQTTQSLTSPTSTTPSTSSTPTRSPHATATAWPLSGSELNSCLVWYWWGRSMTGLFVQV